jgi:hemerythrin
MSQIEWSAGLALGVDPMDDTHREFIDHLNALAEARENAAPPDTHDNPTYS